MPLIFKVNREQIPTKDTKSNERMCHTSCHDNATIPILEEAKNVAEDDIRKQKKKKSYKQSARIGPKRKAWYLYCL